MEWIYKIDDPTLETLGACLAIFGLLLIKLGISFLQKKSSKLYNVISNKPTLLMHGSEILYQNLKNAQTQEDQLVAKLRTANVLNFDQVLAVVLETTGDISVLHGSSSSSQENFEERMLLGVSDKGRIKSEFSAK